LREKLTDVLIALQQDTAAQPYSITHRLKLANAYKALGYPDLAIGDAYRALLLVDEVVEEGEYYDEALDAAKIDFISERIASAVIDTEKTSSEDTEIIDWMQKHWSRHAYVSLCIKYGHSQRRR